MAPQAGIVESGLPDPAPHVTASTIATPGPLRRSPYWETKHARKQMVPVEDA
jgi:hypothetical protein